MWSYPNLIPLSAANGKELVPASVARYIARISDPFAVHRLSE
jgi:hypothetical protein